MMGWKERCNEGIMEGIEEGKMAGGKMLAGKKDRWMNGWMDGRRGG